MGYEVTITQEEGATRPVIITDLDGNSISSSGTSAASITVSTDGIIVQGEKGDPGILISPTAPTDTDLLWLDESNPGSGIIGIPSLGTTGQVLAKATDNDYDVEWTSVTGTQGPAGPTGPQGPQGPAGADGADGANGGTDIVLDTTPQLGGHLDVNGYNITTSSSTGVIRIQGIGPQCEVRIGGGTTYIAGIQFPTSSLTDNSVLAISSNALVAATQGKGLQLIGCNVSSPEGQISLTESTTIAPDLKVDGDIIHYNLSDNITITFNNFTNPVNGQIARFVLHQDGGNKNAIISSIRAFKDGNKNINGSTIAVLEVMYSNNQYLCEIKSNYY